MKPVAPRNKPYNATVRHGTTSPSPALSANSSTSSNSINSLKQNQKIFQEFLRKFDQDMSTLTSRLNDLQGIQSSPSPTPASQDLMSSYFVNSLRSSVDTSRQMNGIGSQIGVSSFGSNDELSQQYQILQTKYEMLEQLMKKIGELDRLVLSKTEINLTGNGKIRRASRGSDLITFPTHLLLVDRLFDLHTLSQRGIMIRNPSTAGQQDPSSNEREVEALEQQRREEREKAQEEKKKLLEMMQKYETDLRNANIQAAESDKQTQTLKSQLQRSATEIEHLKSEISNLNSIKKGQKSPRHTMPPSLQIIGNEMSTPTPSPAPNPGSKELVSKLEAEILELRCRLEVAEKKNHQLEDTIDTNAATNQRVISAILQCKQLLGDEAIAPPGPALPLFEVNKHQSVLDNELQRPLQDLYQSLHLKLSTTSQLMSQLQQENSALTSQLSSSAENDRSIIKRYEENTQHLLTQQAQREEEYQKIYQLCQDYKKEMEEGRRQCHELKGQVGTMNRLTERIEELQRQLLDSDDRRYALDRTLSETQSEVASLRSLNDNLMRKLKNLASQNASKDFAETFEEVMREEMMAMKTAFEAKLRVAVEERDMASRRHQTELYKLQNKLHILEECR